MISRDCFQKHLHPLGAEGGRMSKEAFFKIREAEAEADEAMTIESAESTETKEPTTV